MHLFDSRTLCFTRPRWSVRPVARFTLSKPYACSVLDETIKRDALSRDDRRRDHRWPSFSFNIMRHRLFLIPFHSNPPSPLSNRNKHSSAHVSLLRLLNAHHLKQNYRENKIHNTKKNKTFIRSAGLWPFQNLPR